MHQVNKKKSTSKMISDQDWYTGMIQRDGMGREVGGGFRMGDTCTPMAHLVLSTN